MSTEHGIRFTVCAYGKIMSFSLYSNYGAYNVVECATLRYKLTDISDQLTLHDAANVEKSGQFSIHFRIYNNSHSLARSLAPLPLNVTTAIRICVCFVCRLRRLT